MTLILIGKVKPVEAVDVETPSDIKPGSQVDAEDLGDKRSSLAMDKDEMKDNTLKKWCRSYGIKMHTC